MTRSVLQFLRRQALIGGLVALTLAACSAAPTTADDAGPIPSDASINPGQDAAGMAPHPDLIGLPPGADLLALPPGADLLRPPDLAVAGPAALEACEQLTTAWNGVVTRCDGLLPSYFDVLQPPATVCAAAAASVAAGRVLYDASALSSCVTGVNNESCVDWFNDVFPSCGDLFTGTVPVGGACHSYYDCATGYCDLSGSCPGVCRAYVGLGGGCGSTAFCDPRTSVCGSTSQVCVQLTHPGVGAACGTDGAYCNFAEAFCDGTNHCVARRTSGACTSPLECAIGYLCAGATNATTCQPAVGLGGGCTPGWSQCLFPGSCSATSNTCVERMTGDPCGQINGHENQTCVGASCVYAMNQTVGTCSAYLQDGQACSTSTVPSCAATSTCRGGTCSSTQCP